MSHDSPGPRRTSTPAESQRGTHDASATPRNFSKKRAEHDQHWQQQRAPPHGSRVRPGRRLRPDRHRLRRRRQRRAGDKGAEGSGKGEITFWDNNGGVRTDVWKEIIADFEKENPDIKVKYVGIPAQSVQSKYDTAIQGGGLPDVGGVGTAMLAEIAAQGALEPLDSRLDGSPLKGRLNAAMLESVKAAGGGDAVYTMPTSANNGTLWYRTDLFKAAGLDAPTTWTQVLRRGRQAHRRGQEQVRLHHPRR